VVRVDGVEGGGSGEGEGVRADAYDGTVGEVGLVVAEVAGAAVGVVGWEGEVLEDVWWKVEDEETQGRFT
jgi:hypothetical protein